MTRLGDLVLPVTSRAPAATDAAFRYVDLSTVDASTKSLTEPKLLDWSDAPSRARQRLAGGDVLVATVRPNLNGVAVVPHHLEGAIGSTGFCVLRADPAQLDNRYLFHWVRSTPFVAAMTRLATGASYPAVTDATVKSSEIPLPGLSEQRRIASVLDSVDSVRLARRRTLAKAESLPEALFDGEFGTNDSQTKRLPLSEVVADGTSVTYGIVQAGPEYPGGVPYIRTGDLIGGEIRTQGLRHTSREIAGRFPRSRVSAGEIVMSIRATVGTTALVPDELDGANLTQGTARIAPGSEVDAGYLLGFLRSRQAQSWIAAQVKGATFREITLGRLRELPVLVPPLESQKQFVRAIGAFDTLKDAYRLHLAKLDELFASLQHRAFRGEL